MKKKSPTLQQIRIDKLTKENRELKQDNFKWKLKFCIMLVIFMIQMLRVLL